MAALGFLKNMISKLNIKEININFSSERPRAIAATRYRAFKRAFSMKKDIHLRYCHILPIIILITILGLTACHKSDDKTNDNKRIKLRSKSIAISQKDVKEMVIENNYFDKYWNKSGGFENKYEPQKLIVIDHTTDLIWHQSGSTDFLNLTEAKEWITDLNKVSYGGYNNWRLPTLEEALTLMENQRLNGSLYIDPSFDNWQWCILTGDYMDASKSWLVAFSGRVDWSYSNVKFNYVRPVCSK